MKSRCVFILVILVVVVLEDVSAKRRSAPSKTRISARSISKRSVVQPPETNFECGRRSRIPLFFKFGRRRFRRSPNRRVRGGRASYANTWPWMILLGRKRKGENSYFCGAVLLNRNFVLTAAHCVLDPNPFFARIGEHDHSKSELNPGFARNIVVDDVIIHPLYKVNQGYFDVAILKLSEAVDFTQEVRPICLPWGDQMLESLVDKHVTVTGWGAESFGGRNSPVLKEASLTVFPPSKCQESYSRLRNFKKAYPNNFSSWNIVCAGTIDGERDSCSGDSGGPIVTRSPDGSYLLAGIVASGFGCGKKGFPGLYTPLRNKNILGWIKRIAF